MKGQANRVHPRKLISYACLKIPVTTCAPLSWVLSAPLVSPVTRVSGTSVSLINILLTIGPWLCFCSKYSLGIWHQSLTLQSALWLLFVLYHVLFDCSPSQEYVHKVMMAFVQTSIGWWLVYLRDSISSKCCISKCFVSVTSYSTTIRFGGGVKSEMEVAFLY